nr:manganese efflux pump MntP family protein [Lachnospiraceae bacterium]
MDLMGIVFKSILLGMGLACDAVSVSVANGVADKDMLKKKEQLTAVSFAFFQALMPVIGWILVLVAVSFFNSLVKYVNFIGFIVLLVIGLKMFLEGFQKDEEKTPKEELTFKTVMFQAVATSIDALSVGLTMSDYTFVQVFLSVAIIALVTYVMCFFATKLGKTIGMRIGKHAEKFGGAILIAVSFVILL